MTAVQLEGIVRISFQKPLVEDAISRQFPIIIPFMPYHNELYMTDVLVRDNEWTLLSERRSVMNMNTLTLCHAFFSQILSFINESIPQKFIL